MTSTWKSYYAKTSSRPPAPLLLQGLEHFQESGLSKRYAVDCGAGAGVDTLALLEQGFQVTAIDSDAEAARILRSLPTCKKGGLRVIHAPCESVAFPQNTFFYASCSLPFIAPAAFDQVWHAIVDSIEPHGIFCGNFFGPRDTWADSLLVTSHAEISALFSDFKIRYCEERESNRPDALGRMKHWHLIDVIAHKLTD